MTSGDEHPEEVEGVGCYKAADPNIFGTRGQFCGRQFFHRWQKVGCGGDGLGGNASYRE